jgi:hypothetical protein
MTLEARLQIIRNLFLATVNNDRVLGASTPKEELFYLVKAILEEKVYASTNRNTLIQVLKKSPVWQEVLPFLQNSDVACGRKGCQCHKYYHKDGPCTGHHYGRKSPYLRTACICPGFMQKEF